MPVRPCLDCHRPTAGGSRCPSCQKTLDARLEARRGTRQQRGLGNDWQRISRRRIAEEPWCHICGGMATEGDPLTGDHIVPRSRGGPSSYDNCQPAHRSCNARKGAGQG